MKRTRPLWSLVVAGAVGGLGGCDAGGQSGDADVPVPVAPAKESTGESKPAPQPSAKSPSDDRPVGDADTLRTGPFEKTFDGIAFSVPKGWKEVEVSPRRRAFGIEARFTIRAGDENLELTCSKVGGGVDANVARWKNQFQNQPGDEPEVERLSIDGVEATWVDLRGAYHAGPGQGSGPKTGQRMLAVGIPLGQQDFYVKLLGGREAVGAVAEEFREFVKSARLTR